MPIDSLEERETVERTTAHSQQPRRSHKRKQESHPNVAIVALVLLLFLCLAIWGIFTRHRTRTTLNESAQKSTRIPVSIVHPRPSRAGDELILPANVQAYLETPIYARTNGYLKKWYIDIGGRVKSGQLLAEIDAPEVNKQLDQARADLATAEANLSLSQSTMTRWQELLRKDAVAKQETDDRIG